MKARAKGGGEGGGNEDEDEYKDSAAGLEGHAADYYFTGAELKFIEKNHGNPMDFMLSY